MFPIINANKPGLWKPDIARSVDFYNDWFMKYAPKAYRDTRIATTITVAETLKRTDSLRNITPTILEANPEVLNTLRMVTAPPLARDRLIGLSGVSNHLIHSMELQARIPPGMSKTLLRAYVRSY